MPSERPLDPYRKKRDFTKTPEPAPSKPRKRPASRAAPGAKGRAPKRDQRALRRFVIHRHDATNLHYDLRLEMDGVLKSWAVPRGFAFDPKEKRLAVRTEDHPIEYLEFSGVIPKGEYGAGVMEIWDRGEYEFRNADGEDGLGAGKLELFLRGARLRGEWHMIQLRDKPRDWLMIKRRDCFARGESERLFALDLRAEPRGAMPARPRVMEAAEDAIELADPAWVYEAMLAGERALAVRAGDSIRWIPAATGKRAAAFASLERGLRQIHAERAIVDGVVVALDDQERPSRERLAERLESGDGTGLVYYLFDLLYYEEWDLRKRPLTDRKSALASVLPPLANVLYADHVPGSGDRLLEMVRTVGLPGIVAKRGASAYFAGTSSDWRILRLAGGDGTAGAGDALGVSEALARAAPDTARPAVRGVKFTNPKKIYWPEQGITKGELIDYYDWASQWLLPYLADRPVHMQRFPNGIDGKSFYHKRLTEQIPSWVDTVVVGEDEDGEDVRYIVCSNRETLLYLANLGTIDLHPWLSRRANLESPDFGVIDLDPHGAPFADVVRIARSTHKLLRSIGLRPVLKTSGSSGLHIFVPVRTGYSYEQVRMFCEGIARLVAAELPDIATVERSPSGRGGRVYVDFLQNRREQTIVPPYIVRPVAAASVSTPLDWDELSSELSPAQFTMRNIQARVAQHGDLFRPALDDPQDLLPAIGSLGKMLHKGRS